MLRIYPVELAAELETGSRLRTGEYALPDTTQLDSTCSVFSYFFLPNPSAVLVNYCQFNTHRATPTRFNSVESVESRRRRGRAVCIGLEDAKFSLVIRVQLTRHSK